MLAKTGRGVIGVGEEEHGAGGRADEGLREMVRGRACSPRAVLTLN